MVCFRVEKQQRVCFYSNAREMRNKTRSFREGKVRSMTDQLVVRTYILYVDMLTDPKSFCDQPDVLRTCFRATTVRSGFRPM